TLNPINNATIEILTTVETAASDLAGDYAMAILTAGSYNVAFSAPGYTSDTVVAVLANGVLTIVDVALGAPIPFVLNGQVVEANGGNPIPGADVLITNSDGQYTLTSDGSGNFSVNTFFEGTFDVLGAKWLYKTICFNQFIDSNTATIVITLDSGLYDDFTFDLGWGISGSASSGIWEIGEPVGTNWIGLGDANPDVDVSTDCHNQAYVTGNGGGSAGNDDIDNGNTIVKSPIFDLTGYSEPYVKYERWFFNNGGGGTPNDTLRVTISNGVVSVLLEEVIESSIGNSSWVPRSFKVSDYIAITNFMQLTFTAADYAGSGHLVEAAVDLFQVEEYAVNLTSVNASCNGSCDAEVVALVAGGIAPFTYLWDDPAAQTTDTAMNLCSGTYTATVIDALGDTAISQVTITQPVAIGLSTAIDAQCSASLSDITVTVTNGFSPYTYAWDDPGNQITQTATSLNIGTYTVTVTDNNGCSNTITVTTTVNAALSVTAIGSDPSSCGNTDGTGTASISNGTSPFTYSWDDPGFQSNAIAVGLGSGTYTVMVTDADGCSDTGMVVLSDPGAPILSISSFSMPSCNGDNTGSATVSVSGGAGTFTYTWNTVPIQTDSIATGLGAGTFSVNVTAGGVCTSSISVNITEPTALGNSLTKTDVLCNGDQIGTIDLTVTGGSLPYAFAWDNGVNTEDLDSLVAGTYSVVITDSNGCTSINLATIAEPQLLSASTAITDAVCIGDANGSINLTPSGGVTPHAFDWSEGSTTEDISNLGAGMYLLILSDANGCSIIENASVGTASVGSQTSPITGSVVVASAVNEFYAVTPNTGSVYNWSIVGGTQTGGGQGNSIVVQWSTNGTGQVAVVETDSLGCIGDTVFLNVSISTSIDDYDKAQFEVGIYPNPNTGLFTVVVKGGYSDKLTLIIYDGRGQLVEQSSLQLSGVGYQDNMDLTHLGAGLYFLQFQTDRGIVSRKVVVQ
ncbi:MAG: T9SS type A sorting domain-containing protein, partial [Flavobacteriales bacterium]|nr:T9SS type A sorting domain-containing protein [Flavobacteriales bacterium]